MRSCSEASLSQDGNSPFLGLSSSCQGLCHSPALFAGTSQARKTGARSDLFSELSSASSPSLMLSADVISLKCRVSLWAPSISSPSQEKLQQALSPTKAPHAAQPAMSAAENSGDTTSPPPETLANLPLRMLHPFYHTYFGSRGCSGISSLLSPWSSWLQPRAVHSDRGDGYEKVKTIPELELC